MAGQSVTAIPRVCEWADCLRAVGSSASRYCARHRAAVPCAAPSCRKRALPDRLTCRAHRDGREPSSGQPRTHRRLPAECTVPGCDRAPVARGLCWRHLQRFYRTGTTAEPIPSDGRCRYCAERATEGLCAAHRDRLARSGDIGPPRRINAGRICADPDCARPAYHRGLCSAHYQRAYNEAKRAANLDNARRGT